MAESKPRTRYEERAEALNKRRFRLRRRRLRLPQGQEFAGKIENRDHRGRWSLFVFVVCVGPIQGVNAHTQKLFRNPQKKFGFSQPALRWPDSVAGD
jgi:hypothetical protein